MQKDCEMKMPAIRLFFFAAAVSAQAQTLPSTVSPEVHPDRSVTFRFRAPNAKSVLLALEGLQPAPMKKDSAGGWSLTTAPLAPDIYGYSFMADGQALIDPSNWRVKPNLLSAQSAVFVEGSSPQLWQETDAPHGEVHHHFYRSSSIGEDSDFYVYTPPGYDPANGKAYPVLYLLHGFSDDASAWTVVGRANFILDNLIAQGKARAMIVVMPFGYGTMEMLRRGWGAWSDQTLQKRNFENFSEALLSEVAPRVESRYRAAEGRESRAIAGLSMGGAESLLIGLNNLDEFAWVGAFSSGGLPQDFQSNFRSLDADTSRRLRLLWIACGVEDDLLFANRAFRNWLESKDIGHVAVETPGAHAWPVWRRNLAEFAQLLFQ
jgi:enterochelin esterase-like enzyme